MPYFAYYAMLTLHTPFTTPPITGYSQCAHIVNEKRRTSWEIVQFADGLIADIVEAVERRSVGRHCASVPV